MKRKAKVLLHLVLIALSACMLYYCVGCPPLSTETAFRRAEKAQLVGPSRILGYEDVTYWFGYDEAIIAESEHGYTLFEYHTDDYGSIFGSRNLTYHPKGESVTLFGSSEMDMHYYLDSLYMPVVLFCESKNAVYAELELFTTDTVYTGETYEYTYTADAQRRESGYFLFKVDFSGEVDFSSVDFIQHRLNRQPNLYPSVSGTATIRLYDRDGVLLETHVLDLDELPKT